ncbi:MAG: hypothetical protein A2Z20_00965 [Bdellovibrionales bacterium RBG_16_40_8]|nr:MAG: hypothetical protein A2Z20_00965 [Bdellovibrionales bacterium RBG_16_40_8]
MYLQGNLQMLFDALYDMGVIGPVLEMDWQGAIKEMYNDPYRLFEVMNVANSNQYDRERLVMKLETFDEKTLGYLAMEVAREYADFHSRNEVH